MNNHILIRKILPDSKAFKLFWKKQGPFAFALTSSEFPPVLLEPEEWLFSNSPEILLRALMQFEKRKMAIVFSPFNPSNKHILRPENLIPWKINNFPEEWNSAFCDCFIPEGHLTRHIFEGLGRAGEKPEAGLVEKAFFRCLAGCIEQLGYLLFKSDGSSRDPIKAYLAEWEEDDQDAGLL